MTTEHVNLPNFAVTGQMGAGKSSVAEYLIRTANFQRVAFADKLRQVAVALYGERARNDRMILQKLGPGMRAIDEDIWLKAWDETFARMSGRTRVVVDDVRYPNEVSMLRGLGFVFIHVEAPRNVRIARLQANGKLTDESQLDHDSEHSLPDGYAPDGYIENDGDWEYLETWVLDILNRTRRS